MPTIEGICNQALDVIGYTRHIGNIYEGTKAARIALNLWKQTRDALLSSTAPDWAKIDASLTLLKSAPGINNGMADYIGINWSSTYPPIPWLYEYQYPADCVNPLQIKSTPGFLPVWRPRIRPFRTNFREWNAEHPHQRAERHLIYITQVLDPNDWQEEFQELMVMTLAKKFEPELMPQRMQQQR
jgi:hypothetical protein